MNNAAALKSNATVNIPRAGNVPADMLALNTIASLGFCPVKTVERRERSAYISNLIEKTLTAEGL